MIQFVNSPGWNWVLWPINALRGKCRRECASVRWKQGLEWRSLCPTCLHCRRPSHSSQDSWVLFAHPQEFPLLLCEETSGPESCLPSIKCFHLDSVSVPSGGKMTMSKFKKVQKYKSLVFLETKENRTLWSIDMPNSTYLVIFFIPLLLWGRFIIIL